MATILPPTNRVTPSVLTPDALGSNSFAPAAGGMPPTLLTPQIWWNIQQYVENGLSLPSTVAQLLPTGAVLQGETFSDIFAAYATVRTHCADWKNNTFPQTVKLAGDLADYASSTVPAFYDSLTTNAGILASGQASASDQATAKDTLTQTLQALKGEATRLQGNVQTVLTAVVKFQSDTTDDQRIVCGPDGKSGLVGAYAAKYATEGSVVKTYTDQLAAATAAKATDEANWSYDKNVAATSPTYVWFWPFGTIAAITTASIYTVRALDDLKAVAQDQTNIDSANTAIAAATQLMSYITLASTSLGSLSNAMQKAVSALGLLHGSWGKLADDIDHILTTMTNNIQAAPPLIMALGIEKLKQEWGTVAADAADYQRNAYIVPPQGTRGTLADDSVLGNISVLAA